MEKMELLKTTYLGFNTEFALKKNKTALDLSQTKERKTTKNKWFQFPYIRVFWQIKILF